MGFFLETEKKVPNLRKSKSTTTTEESARRGQVTPVKELDQEQNHSSVKKKKKKKERNILPRVDEPRGGGGFCARLEHSEAGEHGTHKSSCRQSSENPRLG